GLTDPNPGSGGAASRSLDHVPDPRAIRSVIYLPSDKGSQGGRRCAQPPISVTPPCFDRCMFDVVDHLDELRCWPTDRLRTELDALVPEQRQVRTKELRGCGRP